MRVTRRILTIPTEESNTVGGSLLKAYEPRNTDAVHRAFRAISFSSADPEGNRGESPDPVRTLSFR